MDKTYKSIKIGAGEYRELRAYAERNQYAIQVVLTRAIREFLDGKSISEAKNGGKS